MAVPSSRMSFALSLHRKRELSQQAGKTLALLLSKEVNLRVVCSLCSLVLGHRPQGFTTVFCTLYPSRVGELDGLSPAPPPGVLAQVEPRSSADSTSHRADVLQARVLCLPVSSTLPSGKPLTSTSWPGLYTCALRPLSSAALGCNAPGHVEVCCCFAFGRKSP